MDMFLSIMRLSSAALEAQTTRIRVISENIANSQSTANVPGGDPYARKTITFDSELDRQLGANIVRVRSIETDGAPFKREYNPGHPASSEDGYVKLPNVNVFLETADLKEANQTFQANLQTFRQAKELYTQTTDLLRS